MPPDAVGYRRLREPPAAAGDTSLPRGEDTRARNPLAFGLAASRCVGACSTALREAGLPDDLVARLTATFGDWLVRTHAAAAAQQGGAPRSARWSDSSFGLSPEDQSCAGAEDEPATHVEDKPATPVPATTVEEHEDQ